ncbi:MAG TPA: hypothetical protein VN868_02915 [Terriglobales bacterium]|nr:hypothetical protein [Terriglobales bacterium]
MFVASRTPWWRFLESMLGHLVAVAIIMNVSQESTLREKLEQRRNFQHTSITYYRPAPTFPALGSNPGRARGRAKGQAASVQPATIRVAPKHTPRLVAPPDIKMSGPARPEIVANHPALPAMPLSATGRWQRNGPLSAALVVAPPPELPQGSGRRQPSLLRVPAVAPPSNTGGLFSLRASATPSATVVGPAPVVPGVVPGAIHRISDLNIGRSDAVAPAPRLPMQEQRAVSGKAQRILGSGASMMVPPPPSVPRSGTFAGGRGVAPSGGGSQVVPPPPTVQGPGSRTGGQVNWTSGVGMQVVPPAPSVESAGSTPRGGPGSSLISDVQVVPPAPTVQGAAANGAGRGNSPGAGVQQVVAPAPAVEGAGTAARGGRGSSLSSGLQAVAPAPSMDGAGGSRGGDMSPLGSRGMQGGAPAAAVQDAVSSAAGGRAMDATQPPSPETDDSHDAASEELPIRIIGQALALPNSSYFSNYEVFIAERRRGNGNTQLIKLVYVSLPYQRKLSEYGVNSTKIYKLRVTRDSSCDETLLEMTWPQADPSHPDAANPIGPPTLGPHDRNSTLPCYRTTADDYRKAILK